MVKFGHNATNQNIALSHFRVRLIAKIAVIFIWITLLAHRLIRSFTAKESFHQLSRHLCASLPFLGFLTLIVLTEYILFRKLGPRIIKYSKYIDLVFILVFTGEWMLLLNTLLEAYKGTVVKTYSVYGAIGFSSFGWRTLLPILITPYWQLRFIPHTVVSVYLLTFAVINQGELTLVILFRGLLQVVYVILIFYLDHKIHLTLLIGNVKKDQWLQLNDFILNNIPENIAILDSHGDCNFINDNFKKLMQRHNQLQDIKKFLGNLKQIQRIQQDGDTEADSDYVQEILPLERVSSLESRPELPRSMNTHIETINSLEELVMSFGNLITHDSVKDRSFQVFTGKYKQDPEQERSFEIKISFINQDPKKYILLMLRDTTQRDRLMTLEGNIKYKDQLLASVSHELRTPLNGNINLVEAALKSKDIPDKVKETLLTPAVRSSQFLLHLINDILDMSQMKAQKLRLIFQRANLRETLNHTIQLLELHAKKKGITLETNIDSKLPDVFCTDHMRLSQIVLNLINNSVKFTQKGYIRLSALSLKDSEYVIVSVEDTGIGMTKEDTTKLFQDFTHIEFKNREKINPTGVGLGLKIGNDLAKLLGPESNKGISVTSELGKGSTFSFLIENKETGVNSQDTRIEFREELSPLIANEFHTTIEIGLESKIARNISIKSFFNLGQIDMPSMTSFLSCTCPRVLVVDDDPFNILAYEAILSSIGVKYDCVYNGKSAIDKMLNKVRYPCSSVCYPYKVVFMDEEMPEMTGRETVIKIVRLQQQNLLPTMAIIGCTAHHGGEALVNFMKSGIAEYIPKPVSAAAIQKILEKYNI